MGFPYYFSSILKHLPLVYARFNKNRVFQPRAHLPTGNGNICISWHGTPALVGNSTYQILSNPGLRLWTSNPVFSWMFLVEGWWLSHVHWLWKTWRVDWVWHVYPWHPVNPMSMCLSHPLSLCHMLRTIWLTPDSCNKRTLWKNPVVPPRCQEQRLWFSFFLVKNASEARTAAAIISAWHR